MKKWEKPVVEELNISNTEHRGGGHGGSDHWGKPDDGRYPNPGGGCNPGWPGDEDDDTESLS